MMKTFSQTRIPSLDGLRGFSILLVLLGHMAGTVHSPVGDGFHQLGNWGVKFFFVISGYLITTLLLEEKQKTQTISLTDFWVRRFARIIPAYFFYVFSMALLERLHYIQLEPGDLFHSLTFTSNYHEARSWWLNHTWSLSVEEQFYLIWPFAVFFLQKSHLQKILISIIILSPFIRAILLWHFDASPTAMTRLLPATIDVLAVGCLMSIVESHPSKIEFLKSFSPWFSYIAIGSLLITFILPALIYKISPDWFYIFGQSIMAIFSGITIWCCVLDPQIFLGKIMNTRVLMIHGTYSYSLYLWQEPFLNSFFRDWIMCFPQNIVLVYISAFLSFFLVEQPTRRKITSYWNKRRPLSSL